MIDKDGHVTEERTSKGFVVVGGQRDGDVVIRRPTLRTIATALGVAGIVFGAASYCFSWLGFSFAEVGPGAELRKINARLDTLSVRETRAAQERLALVAAQDTIKEAMALFAEQICERQRDQLSIGALRRCSILFNGTTREP